ncbi:hypothetical protein F7731_05645 [Cytobacillus depressus]|uniref:DUF4025 domain-containing protein n=1 Tax=Cytobacillus depressus TaxID=1602942 RepID=A0A6L3V868_9BACI|nr:hypothetical protein [Cytobacillus depressus]KAB2337108.1 hypothetical protein F7731_05645 [Cytobacillus depressus]
MSDQKNAQEDLHHEGRDKVYLDIDRMINEGMSGGSVHMREETTNIEEARDLHEEDPPYTVE